MKGQRVHMIIVSCLRARSGFAVMQLLLSATAATIVRQTTMPREAFLPAAPRFGCTLSASAWGGICPARRRITPHSCVQSSASLPADLEAAANSSLEEHGLEISSSTWHPPALTVFIGRSAGDGANADDCAKASGVLGEVLDTADFGAGAYTLEVSTPGAADVLQKDHEFAAFKGFPVRVTTTEPYKKRDVFEGRLVERSETAVRVGLNGRVVDVPREVVAEVRLCEGVAE